MFQLFDSSMIWGIVDFCGEWRLQRDELELKAPQERSDEEIEAKPAESVHSEQKSTTVYLHNLIYIDSFVDKLKSHFNMKRDFS